MSEIDTKPKEALEILKSIELPSGQLNERSAWTLLALLNMKADMKWKDAESPMIGISPIMDFIAKNYKHQYKPNTREPIRRQTIHQFLQAGILRQNPDNPQRPTNSPKCVYQINEESLSLFRSFKSKNWDKRLAEYKTKTTSLKAIYAAERKINKIPINYQGKKYELSPGGQNLLIEKLINEFCPRYTPNADLVYIGDTGKKLTVIDKHMLTKLKIDASEHGKLPDIILYLKEKKWLIFIEAASSHGPVDAKRKIELEKLPTSKSYGIVFISAFPNRKTFSKYNKEIAWETDVWIADEPSHLIHFNGTRFLGPYEGE